MKRWYRMPLAAFLVTITTVGASWAGIGLAPVKVKDPTPAVSADKPNTPSTTQANSTDPSQVAAILASNVQAPSGSLLPNNSLLVGANRTSIYPTPELFGGTTWQRTGCFVADQANPDLNHTLPAPGHGWPATNPDCIYLGGFGIGPSRAASDVDDGGIWVRSFAVSNGKDTIVHQVIDSVGYFYRYQGSACADCGWYDIHKAVAAATGVPEANLISTSTHSHSGADNYGGWGGVPDWYWAQMRDSAIASAKAAIADLKPGKAVTGSTTLRQLNNERRDHYYSTPDTQAVWLQLRDDNDNVVATMANYAGHPTIVNVPTPKTATWNASTAKCEFKTGTPAPVLHADWPGAASRALEATYGGVGLLIEGGLGNVSVSGRSDPVPPCDADADNPTGTTYSDDDRSAEGTGKAFASAVSTDITRNPIPVDSNAIEVSVDQVIHPVTTNQGLAALGSAGLFSREFTPGTPGADGPGVYHWSKDRNPDRPGYVRGCDSASDIQIRTVAGAHRIGNFGVAFGPGELFSNITEVVKSKVRNNNAALAVYAQANDALGYLIQSFEYDYKGGGLPGEYATQTGEYEEVFALDHCLGDHITQSLIDSGDRVHL